MTKLNRADNTSINTPTPASATEKEALKRALEKERPTEFFDRLLRENNASRVNASVDRRKLRK